MTHQNRTRNAQLSEQLRENLVGFEVHVVRFVASYVPLSRAAWLTSHIRHRIGLPVTTP
jgi:hypothetical protein